MPRYHFHVVDGDEVFDSLGAELPDEVAARRRAVELAKTFANTSNMRIKAVRVTNSDGDILFRVPVRPLANARNASPIKYDIPKALGILRNHCARGR